MNAMPSSESPAPSSSYGQDAPAESSGTSLPAARPTASAVSPLRHHARYLRSVASRVRRVASSTSTRASNHGATGPSACITAGVDLAGAAAGPRTPSTWGPRLRGGGRSLALRLQTVVLYDNRSVRKRQDEAGARGEYPLVIVSSVAGRGAAWLAR